MQERASIDTKYKWDLSEIFTAETFEKAFREVEALVPNLAGFRGKLDAKTTIEYLKLYSKAQEILERMHTYASMSKDLDIAKTEFVALVQRVEMLVVTARTATAFATSELNEMSKELLSSMQNDPKYADYDVFLADIIRNKPHILSTKEEELLSNIALYSGDFTMIFGALDYADLKFEDVIVDGKPVKMSHGTYSYLLQNRDANVRSSVFTTYYKAYKDHINTLCATYAGNVKRNVADAKIRHYASAQAMKMHGENVPNEIYDRLIKTIRANLGGMHEYVGLRKKALRLAELHMYDMHVAITDDFKLSLSYDDAYNIVKEGLKPLGREYAELLSKAQKERWIDVYETPNKRSGAYSSGTYTTKPYILLNYEGTTHDIFTIAHELGHSMHSHYSNKAQCYDKSGYVIFVAEVASTVNEVILLKHLIAKAKTATEKKFYLSYYLDMFRTTMFRQTMFSEFEAYAHAEVEAGRPLTPEGLSDKYLEINKAYYGTAVNHDAEIRYEWARIPHFYRAFYVYKYATGLISAINIAMRILREGESYVERYKGFLSSGCTKAPADLLFDIDVDLKSEVPYKFAMKEFNDSVSALKELL